MPDSISLERLRELLDYDPSTGIFRWKDDAGRREKGSVAGSDMRGYLNIQIDGIKIRAHRLAWLWVNGTYPVGPLDHINGVRHDNRIANLRNATHSQNSTNRQPRRQTGFKGIHLRKATGLYVAKIMKNGKRLHLGEFPTPELAHEAYIKAANELHGEFARVK
jgi:hypothetical protein